MLGWLQKTCPVDTWEKTWTESRMRWLADRFGIERLKNAEVVLPNEEFFPDPYHGTDEDANRLMDRLCTWMALDRGQIDVAICDDIQLPGAAGRYELGERTTIRVAASQLEDPMRLVATLAHELSHELLLGRGLLSPETPDHEWVTDLLPVFLGVGVFAANSTIRESSGQDGLMSWWTMGRQGYLPARIFGYAFALFAFMRAEPEPGWAGILRLDAAVALRDGLQYLIETGDSVFHPDTYRSGRPSRSKDELLAQIETGSPSSRLEALWEIRDLGLDESDVVSAVARCLDDRDGSIPGEAGRTLAALGPRAAAAVPLLATALHAANPGARAGAAEALGVLRIQPETVVPELSALIRDDDPVVIKAASQALRRFGREAEKSAQAVLAALTTAFINCDDELIESLIETLPAIVPNPKHFLRENLADPELRRQTMMLLREQTTRKPR